jgi:hypothetical protein
MSTITAILEPDKDGNVRLPLPSELSSAPVKATATVGAVPAALNRPRFGCLAGKIELAPDFDEPLEDFQDYMK